MWKGRRYMAPVWEGLSRFTGTGRGRVVEFGWRVRWKVGVRRTVGSMQGKEQVLSLVCGWSLGLKLQELLAHIWEERAHSLRKRIDRQLWAGRA